MKHIRTLAVLFAILLLCIILAADVGLLTGVMEFLHVMPYSDIAGHFLLLGLLSLLVSLGFATGRTRLGFVSLQNSSLWLAFVMTIEELSQLFMISRRFSVVDLLANYAGIWLFGALGEILRKRLQSE